MKKKLLSLLILAGVSVAFAHVINQVISSLSKDNGPLQSFDHYFYDSILGKVQFTKFGQGSPILLVHDIHPLSSSYFMYPLAHALAQQYTVYVLDLPGCGQSYSNYQTHTSFEYGQLIHQFIEDVIKTKTILFVNENATLSGISASIFNDSSNLIKELFLINPSSFYDYSQGQNTKEFILKHLLQIPILGTYIYNVIFSRINIKENLSRKLNLPISSAHQWFEDAAYQGAHLGNSKGKDLLISLLSHELNGDCAHLLSQLSIPVHLLYDSHFPLSTKIEYESKLSSIQIHFIDHQYINIPIHGGQQVLDILQNQS